MAYEDNDRNITGINLNNIVGTAGGPIEFKFDGDRAELSVAVNHGYKKDEQWVDTGTTWLRVIATGEYAENNWPAVNKGDKVRIDGGRLESREYDRNDGTRGQSFEIRYGSITVVQAKAESGNYVPAAGEEAF